MKRGFPFSSKAHSVRSRVSSVIEVEDDPKENQDNHWSVVAEHPETTIIDPDGTVLDPENIVVIHRNGVREEVSKDYQRVEQVNEENNEEVIEVNEEEHSEDTYESDSSIESYESLPERGIVTGAEDVVAMMMYSISNNSLNLSNFDTSALVIGDYSDCWHMFERVTSLTLPDSMQRLDRTFSEIMPKLEYVKTGKSLQEVGEGAMEYMKSLEHFDTRDSYELEDIKDYAFNGCSKLVKISFQTCLTRIGDYAFNGCGLSAVNIITRDCKIGTAAFQDCARLRRLDIVYNERLRMKPRAFSGCINLQYIDMSKSTCDEIPISCFRDCNNVDMAKMPVGVTKIGPHAFEDTVIDLLLFEHGVKEIYEFAFRGAVLGALHIGNVVEYIGEGAFSECAITGKKRWSTISGKYDESNYDRFDIPASVTYIGNNALQTTSLTSLDLTRNIICELSFNSIYSTSLVGITLPSRPYSRYHYDYECDNKYTTIRLPPYLTSINSERITEYNEYTEHLDYYTGNGVVKTDSLSGMRIRELSLIDARRIMSYAFVNDATITSISIPTRVTRISNHAFVNLPNLQKIAIPERYRTKFPEIFPGVSPYIDIYLIN